MFRQVIDAKDQHIAQQTAIIASLTDLLARPGVTLNIASMARDIYHVEQAVGVGPKGKVVGPVTMTKVVDLADPEAVKKILADYRKLDAAMSGESNGELDRASLEHLGAAKDALRARNNEKFINQLKLAGKWAFDFASKVGASVLAAIIKDSLGKNPPE